MNQPEKRKLAFGAASTLASEAVGRGTAMIFQLLVANQLGADLFGLVALALASAALLSPLADAGLPNLALREVSRHPDDTSLVRGLLNLKAWLTPLFLLPLAVWALFLERDPSLRLPLVLAGCFYGFQAASDLLRQILRARSETTREFLARLSFPVGNLLALLFVLKMRPGPSGALLALAAGPLALTIFYLIALPGSVRAFEPIRNLVAILRDNIWHLFQSVAYLVLVGLATRVDAFILEHHGGRTEVGRYFAALNLVTAGGFFGQGLSSFLYPRLQRQRSERGRALAKTALLQGALGLFLLGAVVLLGPLVFQSVFRAKSFGGAESLLPGLGTILCFATLDWLWLGVLIGANRTWIAAVNLLPVLLCKLFLAPLWIPSMGAHGMVWASLVGQILTCLAGAAWAWWYFVLRPPSD